MPTVEHSTLTAANLHEPKGADTATEGQVYIADGVGSGAWTDWPFGWGYYKDNAGTQVKTTTPSLLSIDGAGTTTEETHLPPSLRGVGSLWDTTNDKITPMLTGDSYEIRLDLPITAESGSPTELTIELDIAGSNYASKTTIVEHYAVTGKSTPYTISIGFPIFCGTTFKTNGGQFWVYTDTGTATITNPAITLVRTSSGGI